ncbi:uncharacterized protein LOC144623220 isoform X1 [Crassostrea virginica]
MVWCMDRLAPQTPGLQEWFASDSSSKWSCLEQIVFFINIVIICLFKVTSSAKEYTVCVAGWNGVLPIPEYRGLLYMPSHCTGMACEDLLPRRRFMSASWRQLRLMSASLSIPTLAITMFDVFCKDFLEGGGVFAETRVFLSPLPIQIVRAVRWLLVVESEDLIEHFCSPLHVDQSVGIFFSAEVVNSLNTSALLSM